MLHNNIIHLLYYNRVYFLFFRSTNPYRTRSEHISIEVTYFTLALVQLGIFFRMGFMAKLSLFYVIYSVENLKIKSFDRSCDPKLATGYLLYTTMFAHMLHNILLHQLYVNHQANL